MIEIIFDFEGIKTEYELFRMAYIKILNIDMPKNPINGKYAVWDAFRDDFSDILRKEFPADYKYDPDDEWGWSDYADYQSYVETDRSVGPKNEEGVRDDMRLILVNFYDFNHKHRELAQDFLSVLTETYSEVKHHKYTEEDELLKFQILIES
jgi:hypothetical protein